MRASSAKGPSSRCAPRKAIIAPQLLLIPLSALDVVSCPPQLQLLRRSWRQRLHLHRQRLLLLKTLGMLAPTSSTPRSGGVPWQSKQQQRHGLQSLQQP
jgi:hypothetical protein